MDAGKLRVLHVYKDFFPPVLGGIERHLHDLTTGLQKAGVETEVLVCSRNASTDSYEVEGVRIVRVAQWGRIFSAPVSPAFPLWLRRLARDKHVLHFHFPNPTAEIALLLSGLRTPVVVSYHSDIVRQRLTGLLYYPWMKMFLRRVQKIAVATPQHITMSKRLSALREKCVIVPFSVDTERFALTPPIMQKSTQLRAILGTPLVLYVGKFRYYKGLPILLRAMRQLEDIHGLAARLVLVGSGPEELRLRSLAKDLQLERSVHFAGDVPDDQLPAYYHACDAFVLPSVQKAEAFGIVQLEAMACRKPVICTELGTGTSFVTVNGETGMVVPPGDANALARAMNFLLQDKSLCEQYGEAARKRVTELFTKEVMIDRLIGIYRSLQNGKG